MHVEHFMTRNPVACDAADPCSHAASLMRDRGVGSVIVLQGGKVAGIVTDRMLACEVLAGGKGPDTAVRDVMHPSPARLTLDDNIFSAIDTMRSAGVARRLPVVNAENELLGVVSISDVALIAKDLVDAVLLEETHHALQEARILTGAKSFSDVMRRPTKEERLPPRQEVRPVTTPTPPGPYRPGEARGGQEAGPGEHGEPGHHPGHPEHRESRPGFLETLFGRR